MKEETELMCDVAAAVQAGVEIGGKVGIEWDGGVPVALLPPGWKAEPLPQLAAENMLPGKYPQLDHAVVDMQSFMDYLTRFRDEDSVIFAKQSTREIRAEIDYQKPGGVFGRKATHICRWRTKPHWRLAKWMAVNGKRLGQEDMIEFLLERAPDVVQVKPEDPTGADLLEIARTLQAANSLAFESAKVMQSGASTLVYKHTITARAGERGQLEIPERFTVGLPLGIGAKVVPVDVLLRFRILESKELVFVVKLQGIEDLEETAWLESVAELRGNPDGVPVYVEE